MKKIFVFITIIMTITVQSESMKKENTAISAKILPVQENRVHRAGQFWLNVTNNGYFGNPMEFDDPCTGLTAFTGNMPGGSNEQYLYCSGLVFGGYLEKQIVNVGVSARLFGDPLVTTAYEGWTGLGGSQWMAKELWPIEFADDPEGTVKGKIVETSDIPGKMSCIMEDVYDPAASANEQYTTWFSDKYIDSATTYYSYTGIDDYDLRFHIPLGLEVKQKTYAWSNLYSKNIIIADYTVYNRNKDGKDIYDFFMGMYTDFDVGTMSGEWMYCHADDIGGFVHKWDKYFDPATGGNKTVNLDLAWTADNDGRNYDGHDWYTASGEPPVGLPLDGTKGVAGMKVLKNPDPELKYSYNLYTARSGDESFDWSPRWKDGLHSDWKFDLTTEQKGYDDTNQDSLSNGASPLYGGRTEGRPIGDKGRYMVMSNGEIDYGVLDMREVYLGVYTDPDYLTGTSYAQADKWKKWVMEGGSEFPDGSTSDLNQLANGNDVKYILSFGPLGEKTTVNVAVDTNLDSIPDNYISKEVWKFAYGDSLKFTFAFITGENFNYSPEQDPNYDNIDEINLEDGLNKTLYEQGWYDAFNSSIWAERIYDTPLYDTPVTKNGITKGDGWCGEDVGKDGLFAPYGSNGICWWFDEVYPTADEGECDNELTAFTTPKADIYGWTAANEDLLLPYGHQTETATYGEMIRYTRDDGMVPYNSWVRYGFGNGKVDQGDGVPDFAGPPPPPSPKISVSFESNDVTVEWQSHEFLFKPDGFETYTGPEHFIDPFTRIKDFESYTIKVSPNSNPQNFIDLVTFDRENMIYENVSEAGNYLDIPIPKDTIDANPADYPVLINLNGKIWQLRSYGHNRSLVEKISVPDIYEYTVTAELKTIQTSLGVFENVVFYKYNLRLYNKYLENTSYISVVTSDFGDPKMGVPALTSSIYSNMKKIGGEIEDEASIPAVTELYNNYPNPFNPDTKISFSLRADTKAEISIYNVSGQLVSTLIDKEMSAGYHSVVFKADEFNSGVYFYTLKADNKEITKKMLMMK